MRASEAERTILEIERVRRDTRQALNPIWYANLVYGLFFAGTALVALLEIGGRGTAVYWTLGGLLANVVVVRHYALAERELGVHSPGFDASTVILLVLIVGVVFANVLTTGDANAYAPLYVGAACTLAMALVLRDPVELGAAVAIAAVATAVAVLSPADPGIWGNFGLGASLVAAGLAGRDRA